MKDEKINETLTEYANHIRRIWLTNINSPKEIKDKLPQDILNDLGKTYQVLDKSARQEGYKWIHYLWVENKQIIPNTITLFQNHGVIVRELKELKYFHDEKFQRQYQYYIQDIEAIVAASDLIRIVAVLELGGIYLDNDTQIWKWNYDIHYYFDFFGQYFKVLRTIQGINNSIFGAKPGHIILKKLLHYMALRFSQQFP
ncbi:UNKNOWN [Stylonychia lemnae]|uniref:GT44 domain-containing protein n=1 Tax=Stylonychia lemnae TaxID=5949 RepID=A0A078AU28_STYLE|nr:UNKNOWN [Stylonychia lemnae]|eukprot:CDW85905.1 UNKNOWN [Stylonychia lemnae]